MSKLASFYSMCTLDKMSRLLLIDNSQEIQKKNDKGRKDTLLSQKTTNDSENFYYNGSSFLAMHLNHTEIRLESAHAVLIVVTRQGNEHGPRYRASSSAMSCTRHMSQVDRIVNRYSFESGK